MKALVMGLGLALSLWSCGGGSSAPVDGSTLPQRLTPASPASCFNDAATDGTVVNYQFVDGTCTRVFAPMRAERPLGTSKAPQAAAALTWTALLSWAERTYPQYFNGASQNGTYQDYTYRYYPATQNYIGLRNSDMVYVLGPIYDDSLLYVGTLGSLACQVDPAGCANSTVPAATATPTATASGMAALAAAAQQHYPQYFQGTSTEGTSDGYQYRLYAATGIYLATRDGRAYVLGNLTNGQLRDVGLVSAFGASSLASLTSSSTDIAGSAATSARLTLGTATRGSIDTAGDTDWYAITLTAGVAYTFDQEGVGTGGGDLYDPILRLMSSTGQQLAINDDASFPDNINSRIVYTPTVGGTYYLSAQAYESSTGTFTITARSGATTGGTAGTGSTGGTGSTSSGVSTARPYVEWADRPSTVISPPFYVMDFNLCAPDCERIMSVSIRGSGYNQNLHRGLLTRPTWNANGELTSALLSQVSRDLNGMLTSLWAQSAKPSQDVIKAAINSGFAQARTPSTVASTAASNLSAKGFPTGYTAAGTGSGGGTTGGTGTTGSTGGTGTDATGCTSKPYTGDSSDPQVYSFDYIAQIDQCLYRATGNSNYLTDGDRQCKVLAGLIQATNSSFRPQYCRGSSLIR